MPPGQSCRSWLAVVVLLKVGWCLLFLVVGGVGGVDGVVGVGVGVGVFVGGGDSVGVGGCGAVLVGGW